MKQRIITATVCAAILLPILILADYIVLPIALALCTVIALYEMLRCIGMEKEYPISVPLYVLACLLPLGIRFGIAGRTALLLSTVLVCLLYFFSVLIFFDGKYRLHQICIAFFTSVYILLGFNSILVLHDGVQGGEYVYLIVFIGAWITDIFAYFCGMLFGRGGKHKLIPSISPKKTVEGAVGGVVFCMLAMILFGVVVEAIEPKFQANFAVLACSGILISAVAQIGDLAMSAVKRVYRIKDYGKLFPGHGGMLDRFDSVLAVSVMLLALSAFVNFFQVI